MENKDEFTKYLEKKNVIMELLRLEETSEVSNPASNSRQGQIHHVNQDQVQLGFEYLLRMKTPKLLQVTCSSV